MFQIIKLYQLFQNTILQNSGGALFKYRNGKVSYSTIADCRVPIRSKITMLILCVC